MILIIYLIFINIICLSALTKKGVDVYVTRDREIISKSGKKLPFPNGDIGFIFDCTCGDPILPNQENCRSNDKDTSICYYYFDEEGNQQIKDKVIYFYGQTNKITISEVSIMDAQLIDNNTISIIYSQALTRKYDGAIPHWCQDHCYGWLDPPHEWAYANCVRDFECRENELFHMIIDRNGDQKSSTVTTKLTNAFANRVTSVQRSNGEWDYISSNCEKSFIFQFRRNFDDGYYLVFDSVVFEFDNSGSYVRTLHDKYFNCLTGCNNVLNGWLIEYVDSDFDDDFSFFDDNGKFDILKLSNGKTVTVRTPFQLTNIDLFDNFGNMIIYQENSYYEWGRIFEFEDGYFVLYKQDKKLMIMKFNFEGHMTGQVEEIYDFSSNINLGSVIKNGNKISIIRYRDTYGYTQNELPTIIEINTFDSTNNKYTIEYISPKNKEQQDMYDNIANNVYTSTVLHDIEYELYNVPSRSKCRDKFTCYNLIYKRKSIVDLTNIVSISTPGTLPPTPTPTTSPTSYPTSLPTFSHSPTFLPTIEETSMPSNNHLEIMPPDSNNDEETYPPESTDDTDSTNDKETDPPDSTDDTDSTNDKNTKDSDDNNNTFMLIFCISALTLGCFSLIFTFCSKLSERSMGCTYESDIKRTISFGNSRYHLERNNGEQIEINIVDTEKI